MPRSVRRTRPGLSARYTYVSPSRPGILLPRAPAPHRRFLEARIRMAAVGIAHVAGSNGIPADVHKASVISGYLDGRPQWVGTVAEPGLYVRGAAQLRQGVLRDYVAELAVFAGVVDGVKLALIGSPDGLLDATWEARTERGLDYYLLQSMRQDADNARAGCEERPGPSYAAAVDSMLEPGVLPPNPVRTEFLAKPLFQGDGVLVATPIFVARSR
ncbi:DUF7019 family protein [Streptomyces sp. NPDC001568]|uniref:DUF7019 family protein n=1 Tax=Streptomyces sp. NPDC001568 TaxID=3364588 RepID=UPI00368B369A